MNPATPSSKPSHEEAIAATAAAWLAQRDSGLSNEEAAEFARWRGADGRHEAAVARLETTWAALQALREFRPEARVHPDRDLLARPRFSGLARVVPFPARAVALALAAALVLAAVWAWRPAPAVRDTMVATPVYATTTGGYQRVTLTDGSVLELNASSEVRVSYAPAERRVRLVRGEAHFTVAKNKARPFIVEAGAVAVRAVGTAFNVRVQSSAIEVLVTEGRVQVEERAPAGASATLPTLGAGERLVVSSQSALSPAAASVVVEKISDEAMREELAWQGPRLIFADTPLAQVVVEFNRRNQVQIVLADAELGALTVVGSFRAENVEAFVRLIATGDIVVERPAADRIVLRKAR